MPAKEDKGDAVLCIHFIIRSVSSVLHIISYIFMESFSISICITSGTDTHALVKLYEDESTRFGCLKKQE